MTTRRGDKTICIDFDSPEQYDACVRDKALFRSHLESWFRKHPLLFPPDMAGGFTFHDNIVSAKQELVTCRIRLKASRDVYQIRPSFVMPYMTSFTDDVEKGLYLRRWNVPYEALAYVFGRDPMFWYRCSQSLGRPSIVGATVRSPERLPEHLVADEKHTWRRGERAYVATTVADGCIFGAEVSMSASPAALEGSYGVFAEEALNVAPNYQPKTVCVDPWQATRQAWAKLFSSASVILCFLHSILKLRKCKDVLDQLRGKLIGRGWHVYQAKTKKQFSQRMRRFREWADANLPPGQLLDAAYAMFAKRDSFKRAYDFDNPYRTTNGVDRLIDYQDRVLYGMRYFHGELSSASMAVRSMALLWNFHPYGRRARPRATRTVSPFSELNGFAYHDNWLRNLQIASSMGGRRRRQSDNEGGS
jgi:hypothetical protein